MKWWKLNSYNITFQQQQGAYSRGRPYVLTLRISFPYQFFYSVFRSSEVGYYTHVHYIRSIPTKPYQSSFSVILILVVEYIDCWPSSAPSLLCCRTLTEISNRDPLPTTVMTTLFRTEHKNIRAYQPVNTHSAPRLWLYNLVHVFSFYHFCCIIYAHYVDINRHKKPWRAKSYFLSYVGWLICGFIEWIPHP